jgi:hypothetical protein
MYNRHPIIDFLNAIINKNATLTFQIEENSDFLNYIKRKNAFNFKIPIQPRSVTVDLLDVADLLVPVDHPVNVD